MDIKTIKTDADYRAALKEIESLMIAGPDTPEGEKLDVMVTLIEAYEAKHFPIGGFMSKKVFRPFNTWGIVAIGFVTTTVLAYTVSVL